MAIIIDENIREDQIIKCCAKCYFAKEKKCTCQCGGLFHGKGLGDKEGYIKKVDKQEELELELVQGGVGL